MFKRWLKGLISQSRAFKNNLFISYMLILLVPMICISIFFYYKVVYYIQDEIVTSNQTSLDVFSHNVDRIISKGKANILELAASPHMKNFYLSMEENAYEYLNSQSTLLNRTSFISRHNIEEINSIYIYNNRDGIVLSSPPEYRTYMKNFHDGGVLNAYRDVSNYTITATRLPYDKDYNKQDVSIEYADRFDSIIKNRKVISVIFPMRKYDALYDGLIVVNIYEDALNYGNNKEQYMIMNGSEIVSSSMSVDMDMDDMLENIHGNKGAFFTHIAGDKTLVTYDRSQQSKLLILKFKKVAVLYQNLNKINLSIILLIVGMCAIGVIYSYKRSKQLYEPIRNTLEQLNIKISRESNKRQSELKLITYAVNDIIDNYNALSKIHEGNKKKIYNKTVLDIFKGSSGYETLFDTHYDYYTTVILSIDRYLGFRKSFNHEEQWYYKALVLKLTEEASNKQLVSKGAILENGMIGLITAGCATDEKEFYKIVHDTLLHIKSQLAIVDDFTVTVSVGNVYEQATFIYDSYIEAKEALSYRMLEGYESLIYAKDVLVNKENKHVIKVKKTYLHNYLSSGAYEQMIDYICDIVSEIKTYRIVSREHILQLFYGILNDIAKFYENENRIHAYLGDQVETMYEQLATQEVVDDMVSVMKDYILQIKEYHADKQEITDNHIDRILTVIKTNQNDSNFNIQQLVNEVGISYPQINRILQQNLGVSYNQYLTSIRIQKAKTILEESDQRIEDVALQVGYYNGQSFTRNFKKIEGMTPSEYRKISKRPV